MNNLEKEYYETAKKLLRYREIYRRYNKFCHEASSQVAKEFTSLLEPFRDKMRGETISMKKRMIEIDLEESVKEELKEKASDELDIYDF